MIIGIIIFFCIFFYNRINFFINITIIINKNLMSCEDAFTWIIFAYKISIIINSIIRAMLITKIVISIFICGIFYTFIYAFIFFLDFYRKIIWTIWRISCRILIIFIIIIKIFIFWNTIKRVFIVRFRYIPCCTCKTIIIFSISFF